MSVNAKLRSLLSLFGKNSEKVQEAGNQSGDAASECAPFEDSSFPTKESPVDVTLPEPVEVPVAASLEGEEDSLEKVLEDTRRIISGEMSVEQYLGITVEDLLVEDKDTFYQNIYKVLPELLDLGPVMDPTHIRTRKDTRMALVKELWDIELGIDKPWFVSKKKAKAGGEESTTLEMEHTASAPASQ